MTWSGSRTLFALLVSAVNDSLVHVARRQETSERVGSLPMPKERICGLRSWRPPSATP